MAPVAGGTLGSGIPAMQSEAQYAEARCLVFDFKFKKSSIKQAIFITDIFPSRIKAPKQKKFEAVFLRFFKVFARISAFFKI